MRKMNKLEKNKKKMRKMNKLQKNIIFLALKIKQLILSARKKKHAQHRQLQHRRESQQKLQK